MIFGRKTPRSDAAPIPAAAPMPDAAPMPGHAPAGSACPADVKNLARGGTASKAVVTFHTTSDAMAFEAYARRQGLPGRLTTVPRQVTAGCGYAWTASLEDGTLEALHAACSQAGLEHEGVYLL